MEDIPAEEFKKLSKGQKKALKDKLKKEAEAKAKADAAGSADSAPANVDSTPPPEVVKSGPKGAGAAKGKKGKGKTGGQSAAAKAIQARLEEKRREEEELKAQLELEKQQAIEEEKRRKEEKKKRKDEEKAQKALLKSQGLLISKKEQEEKERLEKIKQSLIAQGMVELANKEEVKDDKPKQKIVYGNKKKNNKQKQLNTENNNNETNEQTDLTEDSSKLADVQADSSIVTQSELSKAAETQAKVIDNDMIMDDWEDLLDDTTVENQVKAQTDDVTDKNLDSMKVAESMTHPDDDQKPTKADDKNTNAEKAKPKQKPSKQDDSKSTGGSIFDRGFTSKKGGKTAAKKGGKATTKTTKSDRKFRCPIICVLGHVDTGKTLLLDKIRKTNVQKGEAGGITQQIGATYFPGDNLQTSMDRLDDSFGNRDVHIPGLLVIDTPGHESFTNLRSRGSGLCDLAVLVVDLMHGLEPQTLESIELLKQKKTPFIVALNKIDRCNMWASEEFRPTKESLNAQHSSVISEYEDKRDKAFLQFNERGMNICEYWNNPEVMEESKEDKKWDFNDTDAFINAVPTSAMTGEGIPDLIGMIVRFCQNQLKHKVTERNDEFQCTVLEVKKISGIGTTVDVVLVNGKLSVGDTIVLAGFNGPIVTKIRALLTPQPMKEMRVKGEYLHHEELYGAMGIKISAPDLDHALAGGELLKAEYESQIDEL